MSVAIYAATVAALVPEAAICGPESWLCQTVRFFQVDHAEPNSIRDNVEAGLYVVFFLGIAGLILNMRLAYVWDRARKSREKTTPKQTPEDNQFQIQLWNNILQIGVAVLALGLLRPLTQQLPYDDGMLRMAFIALAIALFIGFHYATRQEKE